MRCDTARRSLSDRLDAPTGSVGADTGDRLEAHLAGCAACWSFERHLGEVRRHLHLQPVGGTPDVAPQVRALLERRAAPQPGSPQIEKARRTSGRSWSPLPAVAASFVAAFVLAAALVGLTGPPEAGATDVTTLVLTGQTELLTLAAAVEVEEHGWHPEVPVRHYTGDLRYAAPETFGLELRDRTDYPSTSWKSNDVTIVVDRDRAWGSGMVGCPTAALPECLPEQPREQVVAGREPFDRGDPVPLDLVLPVASFVVAGAERPLGETELDGRPAVGVEVTAAQIVPLLEGIERHGNWRPIHPADEAAVWLDAELGVPLLVEVRAGGGFERDRWAVANGLDEMAGDPVLTWRFRDVRINDGQGSAPTDPPVTADVRDRGFRDGEAEGPVPTWLPDGMTPHRRGHVGGTSVASFADGRAWVAVRSTTSWRGGRLFGQPTSVVRRIALPGFGTAYVAESGDRVLVHGDDVDVEVVGSLELDELIRVAASLGIEGRTVPGSWAEATTTTLGVAVTRWPGLLTLPDVPDGYEGPAVSMSDLGVVQSFAGSGSRAFVVTHSRGETLGPPLDALILAVELRGRQARFTPDRGTLEWVEGGHVVTVSSRALGLSELASIAEALEVAS